MQGIAHNHARRLSELRLIREATEARPAFGTAVSHALLARVAAGDLGATFRLHVAQPVLSFGKQDALEPGFPRAVAAAREAGFAPVVRLAGGRAAVFHEGTLALAHAIPETTPREGTRDRFEKSSGLLAEAFGRLGVDARVGEVDGEYCPGAWSVNARGEIKLAGIGQRLIMGAAHVGGVVVATGTQRLRDVLVPVYDALGLEWDPATAGSVEDEVEGVTAEAVADAIVAVLGERYELVESRLDQRTLDLAESLTPKHAIDL
jgi:octanoyl-[GcvH]:protein N-octanoyltransferase